MGNETPPRQDGDWLVSTGVARAGPHAEPPVGAVGWRFAPSLPPASDPEQRRPHCGETTAALSLYRQQCYIHCRL